MKVFLVNRNIIFLPTWHKKHLLLPRHDKWFFLPFKTLMIEKPVSAAVLEEEGGKKGVETETDRLLLS